MDRQRESEFLLKQVYQNAADSEALINGILPAVKNKRLSQELERQKAGYSHIAETADVYLSMTGRVAPVVNPVNNAFNRAKMRINLANANDGTAKLIDLLNQSKSRKVAKQSKLIESSDNSGTYAADVAKRLIQFEERNISRLQQFKGGVTNDKECF